MTVEAPNLMCSYTTGDKRRDYSSSDDSRDGRHGRRKSLGEQALGALGLGGAGGAALSALTGRSKSHDHDDRSSKRDRRSRRYSSSDSYSSRSRSRGRGKDIDTREKIIQAAKAAVLAGGTEAWRMRKEPGGWGGPKGRRVLTAAVGAAGVNGIIDKDPDKKSTRHTIESVIGGLASNRILNGSRDDERSRSRSRGRGRDDDKGGAAKDAAGLGAGALAAAAAKAFANRSKSRGNGRRDYSSSSDDSRYGGRRGTRRTRSVSDYMRKGMGALGIGGNIDKRDTTDRGSRRDLGHDNEYDLTPPRSRGGVGGRSDAIGQYGGGGGTSSSDDDISSSEEERERKKLGKKQLITAGLASVATIHAAHNVYQSVHMREARAKEVAEGEMSPEEARKKRNKARLHNAAAVGIAALGIKGAYSEWKEMKEQHDEVHEFDLKRRLRHERRLLKQHAHDNPEAGSTHSGHTTPGFGYGNPHTNTRTDAYMNSQPQYRSSAPNLTSDPNAHSAGDSGPGPHYSDDNPYHNGSYPAPDIWPPPGYR